MPAIVEQTWYYCTCNRTGESRNLMGKSHKVKSLMQLLGFASLGEGERAHETRLA